MKKVSETTPEKEKNLVEEGREPEISVERKSEEIEQKTEKEIVDEKVTEELNKMKLMPDLDEEIEKETIQIRSLQKEGKLLRLLELAKEKGVSFAIIVAKKMKDPYTLDAFHDILSREGYYKKLSK
jgi:hypothetical protein